MNDYISRQAALDEFQRFGSVWMEYTDDMPAEKIAWMALKNAKSSMIDVLNGLPSADAVEVVRCKDCKHLFEDNKCPLRTWWTHTEDDFCSYGERKDG